MSRNFFKKSFLASLSAVSIVNSSNAREEIAIGKESYNNLGENEGVYTPEDKENICNENNLSLVQRHPKKLIAAAVVGGAILKQPTKDLSWGVVFPVLRSMNKLFAPKIYGPELMGKMLGQNFSDIKPAEIIKQGAGHDWCWIASLQGVLNTLKYNVKQEDLYRLTHPNLEAAVQRPDGIYVIPPKNPAFFMGNRNNKTCDCPDGLLSGIPSGNGFDLLAKKISRDLNGYRVLILREKESNMTASNLELIIRNISEKVNGGWFCIVDPITPILLGYSHAIMCRLDGENLLFENCLGPIAYSMNIKRWCGMSNMIINQIFNLRERALNSSCIFEAFGFTREKIKSQIIYTLTNNGGLDIYEH